MGIISGQAASLLGVSTKTLAIWAAKGLLKAERTPGNWRLFDVDEVLKLKRIREKKSL